MIQSAALRLRLALALGITSSVSAEAGQFHQAVGALIDRACFAELDAAGARFSPVPDAYGAPGCNKLGTVKVSALSGDASQFTVTNLGAFHAYDHLTHGQVEETAYHRAISKARSSIYHFDNTE